MEQTIRDPLGGFIIEEYVNMTGGVIFEVRNCLAAILGYSELAKEEMDPLHPAFSHLTRVHQISERAFAAVTEFDREMYLQNTGHRLFSSFEQLAATLLLSEIEQWHSESDFDA